jgi:hypothetical protein
VGKQRTRWEDVVRRNTSQILGIRKWRRRAEDREEWKRLYGEARAQKVLLHLRWMDGLVPTIGILLAIGLHILELPDSAS